MIDDYKKQMELIKVEEFKQPIHVIGAGALGSWIVFFLLKMGFDNIHVWDYDDIEEHNLPNQMFAENQIGEKKVVALAGLAAIFFDECMDDKTTRLTIHHEKVTTDTKGITGYVFCAVDSMVARKEIFTELAKMDSSIPLWIEGRLSLYGAYVYSINPCNPEEYEMYEKTLYADVEAEVSACGVSQTALPSAVNAASLMVMQMIEHFNKGHVIQSLRYSIPYLDVIKKEI